MATRTGHFIITMIGDLDLQTPSARFTFAQIDGLKAGVGHRVPLVDQRLATAGTDCRIMGMRVMGRPDLRPSKTGGAELLPRLTGRFPLRSVGRGCGFVRGRSVPGLYHWRPVIMRRYRSITARPRRPATRRTRTVRRPLIQPFLRLMQIREQLRR